jgi:Tol biopolymer transport system component
VGFGFSLSADGQQMVFMRRDAKSGSGEVIVAATGHPDGRVVEAGPTGRMGGLPGMSPQGNQVFFFRKGGASPQDGGPNGTSLWVVAADGSGARRLASAWGISSAVWDPSGRFIAYEAQPDSGAKARVIRIVEVATGVQRGNVPLAELRGGYCRVADWSQDGRSIGFFTSKPWWEYWVVQGLQEGVR